MKKIVLSVAFVATFGLCLVSCSKDKAKCIEVIINYTDPDTGSPATSTEYVWQSENQVEVLLDSISRTYKNVTATTANTMPGVSESSCKTMNPPGNGGWIINK